MVGTDHAMPGMTGAQLAAILCNEFPSLSVILAPGHAELLPDVGDLIVARLNRLDLQDDLAAALSRAVSRAANVVPLRVQRT